MDSSAVGEVTLKCRTYGAGWPQRARSRLSKSVLLSNSRGTNPLEIKKERDDQATAIALDEPLV